MTYLPLALTLEAEMRKRIVARSFISIVVVINDGGATTVFFIYIRVALRPTTAADQWGGPISNWPIKYSKNARCVSAVQRGQCVLVSCAASMTARLTAVANKRDSEVKTRCGVHDDIKNQRLIHCS